MFVYKIYKILFSKFGTSQLFNLAIFFGVITSKFVGILCANPIKLKYINFIFEMSKSYNLTLFNKSIKALYFARLRLEKKYSSIAISETQI